jgi:hypothetical protein
MIKKLAEIANELDAAGELAAADRVDAIIDNLRQAGSGDMKRHPDWVVAASRALQMLDSAMDCFNDKSVTPPGDLVWAIEDLRKIVEFNKKNPAK